MRTSSGTKRKPEFEKYMESRVLITSNSINPLSKNITSKLDLIKQQISRQFHQKFLTDKKRTTSTKRNNSRSKSKFQHSKPVDSVAKKINFHQQDMLYAGRNSAHITTQNQSEMENFREKFYDLQDKFLGERQKMIDNFEKMSLLKQNIIQFLEEPSQKSAEKLQQHFTSQRHQKLIQKFISMNQDIEFAQTTLKQILSIVEVDDIETLITELKNRQLGSKNLGQCSYKILEIQAAYNKLQQQSQQKLKQVQKTQSARQKQLQDQLQRQLKQVQTLMQNTRKQQERKYKKLINQMFLQMKKPIHESIAKESATELMSSVNHEESHLMFVTFDKNPLKKQRGVSDFVIQTKKVPFYPIDEEDYTIEQILQSIMQLFKQMEDNLIQIQKQAQQNHQKLMHSKHDFDRMERMIENLTQQSNQQKNKLIQHFEDILNQKQCNFAKEEERLKSIIRQKQKQYSRIQEQIIKYKTQINEENSRQELWKKQKNEANQKLKIKQKIINKIINIICDATGEEMQIFGIQQNQSQTNLNSQTSLGQIIISKIQVVLKKHLLLLKQNLQAAQNLILWHEKQLQIKQGLLKEFDFNLKKLIEQSQMGQEKEKKTSFERDEYKYLLGNLRENVREMKKDYQVKILQVAKQKDQQYLNSNKDILRDNKRLNNQIQELQKNTAKLTQQLKAETASHGFYRKKSQQFQASLIDLRKKLMNAQTEAAKYKQCLTDIQSSFKEVQNMSEKTTQKMIGLEQQKKLITSEVNDLRSKSQSLIAQIQLKDQNFNKLQYACEQLKKKFEKITKLKEDLQLQNSNIRIKNMQLIEQSRSKFEQSKKIQYQNAILNKQNKKLMQQVNNVTKKLINYVSDKQQIKVNKSIIRQQIEHHINHQFQKIKKQYKNFKLLMKDYLDQYKILFEEEAKQINLQLFSHLKVIQRQNVAKSISSNRSDQISEIKQQKQIKLKDKLAQLREEIKNIKQYCKYVKNQFKYQLKVVKEMLNEPEVHMKWQQEKISSQLNNIIKVQLLLNSLRNQNDELKQIVRQNNQTTKIFLKSYQNKLNQMLTEIQQSNKQSAININEEVLAFQTIDANESFNKYLKSGQEKKDRLLDMKSPKNQKNIELQYKSPQFLKLRKDTLTQQEQQSLAQKTQNQQKAFVLKPAASQKDDDKLKNSNASNINSETQRVMRILNGLKQLDNEDPKVPYFQQIRSQYRQLKKKLIGKNLNLDLSAVSFRPNTLSSPISLASKEFLQQRRFNTDPNEDQLFPKQSNRSEHRNDRSLAGVRKQNSLLNSRLERLEQELKQFQTKEDEYKIQISQLERQVVQLQNQSSSKMKQNLFKSFITQIFSQNWQKAKSNCRTILKLFKLQKIEIDQFMDKFQQFLNQQKQKDKNKIKQRNKEKDKNRQKMQQKQSEAQLKPIVNRQNQFKKRKQQDQDYQNNQKDQKRNNNGFFSGLFNNAKN